MASNNVNKMGEVLQLQQIPTTSAPATLVDGMIYYDSTLGLFQFRQNGSTIATGSGTVNSGTAGDLALYPSSSTAVSDTYTQNSQPIKVAIAAQPTRSAGITYNIPNPGDAITSADVVLTQGAQTIAGAKTFSNDVVMNGNLTVNGTTTSLNTTNTTIEDKLVTLNKGGATASGGGSGIEIEENALITGFIKSSAARTGFDLKAPATAGTATIVTDASSWTYTLPGHSGTIMTNVVDDTAPQLGGDLDVNGHAIQSVSNGNIVIAPNGTGRVRKAKQGALTRYVDEQYIDAMTLTASTTAVNSSFTFDSTLIKAQFIEYTIVEATTFRRRIGLIKVIGDGNSGVASSNISITDISNETADVGVTWSAALNGNNIELSYTTTANNKTMQALVKRFLA